MIFDSYFCIKHYMEILVQYIYIKGFTLFILFILKMDNLNITKIDKGVAKCPFNPNANITTLMTENGRLFIASPTDFSGTDPAILRADVVQVNSMRVLFEGM